MKKFTLIAAAAAMMATTAVAAPAGKRFVKTSHQYLKTAVEKSATSEKGVKVRRAAAPATGVWRAKTEKVSYWDEGEWLQLETVTNEWTSTGLLWRYTYEGYTDLDMTEKSYSRKTTDYNENEMPVEILDEVSEDGVTFENSTLVTRVYDPKVTTLVVENNPFTWVDSEWVRGGNDYKRTVTRDAAGNVTKVEVAVNYDGVYDPVERLEVAYGADGKASTITLSVLDYDYDNDQYVWGVSEKYSDVVWDTTNGQIVSTEDIISLGANRIKSANVESGDDTYKVTATYSANGFECVMDGIMDGDPTVAKLTVDFDENGGGKQVETYDYEYEGEQYHEVVVHEVRYDAFENLTLEKEYWESGEWLEIYTWVTGEVDYNTETGLPEVWTTKLYMYDMETQDPDEGEFVNDMKVEYSDYADFSGVESVEVEDAAEAVYYTIGGLRVDASALAPGMYIRRNGKTATKVFVR